MRESRNPFRLRAAEQIESDGTFARLFEPGLIDALPRSALFVPLVVLQSAPGAGKSSLLRLFTPSVLAYIRQNSQRDDYRDLASRLQSLGAISDERIEVLGVPISCAQTFASLDQLEGISGSASLRLFHALLNARIVLAVLREAAAFYRAPLNAWLDRVEVSPADSVRLPGVSFPLSGRALFDWASSLEEVVANRLDDFGVADELSELRAPDDLAVLALFAPGALRFDGTAVDQRLLVLLDDVQWLTDRQRSSVRNTVLRMRANATVWMAERYESLATAEILEGSREGRDVVAVRLENFWRQPTNKRKLEQFLSNLGDRRARVASESEVHSLDDNLSEVLEDQSAAEQLAAGLHRVKRRVEEVAQGDSRFAEWIAEEKREAGSTGEQLLSWRRLEILMHRVRRRSQLDLGMPLSAAARKDSDGSDVRAAAALFLARELDLPYYYGSGTLVALSSSNVEQYLSLAGDLFEELVSAALLGRSTQLAPRRQDKIVRAAARARWDEIPSRVNNGRAVYRFLKNAAAMAEHATYRPTAPYAPGVTGFAYLSEEHGQLYSKFPMLGKILASAVADNLLELQPDYSCKGKIWMVYYLNRLLCAQFALPLGYGGFREQKLEVLSSWVSSHASPQGELMEVGSEFGLAI